MSERAAGQQVSIDGRPLTEVIAQIQHDLNAAIAQGTLPFEDYVNNVVTVTEDATLDNSFAYKWVRVVVPEGFTVTLTVAAHFRVGGGQEASEMTVECAGAGSVLIEAGTGVTVARATGTAPVLSGVGSVAGLKQTAYGEWVLFGGLEDL